MYTRPKCNLREPTVFRSLARERQRKWIKSQFLPLQREFSCNAGKFFARVPSKPVRVPIPLDLKLKIASRITVGDLCKYNVTLYSFKWQRLSSRQPDRFAWEHTWEKVDSSALESWPFSILASLHLLLCFIGDRLSKISMRRNTFFFSCPFTRLPFMQEVSTSWKEELR